MPELRVDFEVWCECGNGLCRQSSVKGTDVTVELCKDCLESAREEGYARGHDVGYEEGYDEGAKGAEA